MLIGESERKAENVSKDMNKDTEIMEIETSVIHREKLAATKGKQASQSRRYKKMKERSRGPLTDTASQINIAIDCGKRKWKDTDEENQEIQNSDQMITKEVREKNSDKRAKYEVMGIVLQQSPKGR